MASIETGLLQWIETETGLGAYWFTRPQGSKRAVVFRCISPGFIDGNLRAIGVKKDIYSITVYHDDPDAGKTAIQKISDGLNNHTGTLGDYSVQLIELSGGFDQPLRSEAGGSIYQFNRDFKIHH